MLAAFLTPEEDMDVPPDGLQHSLRVVLETCAGTKAPDGGHQHLRVSRAVGGAGTSECLTRAAGQPPGRNWLLPRCPWPPDAAAHPRHCTKRAHPMGRRLPVSSCWTCSKAHAGPQGTSQRPGVARSTRTPSPKTSPEARVYIPCAIPPALQAAPKAGPGPGRLLIRNLVCFALKSLLDASPSVDTALGSASRRDSSPGLCGPSFPDGSAAAGLQAVGLQAAGRCRPALIQTARASRCEETLLSTSHTDGVRPCVNRP